VTELVNRAAAEGMTHLALTDTNALYGAVAFERACRAAGIQPILGMTVTVPAPLAAKQDAPGRLVLLATGAAGYRSLCRLSSLLQGHPERASLLAQGLSWEALAAHREGLICLSGGRAGWVERLVRAGDLNAAHRYAGRLAGIYEADAYLSLELHRPQDRAVAQQIAALGERLGLRAVAVQPVYCMAPQDAPRLRLLAAIDHNCPLENVPAAVLPSGGDPSADLHWLAPDEVAARFADFPQALAAVEEIAARCQPALPGGQPLWPALDLPHGQTPDEALADLVQAGLVERYGPHPSPTARQRLEKELSAVARHGCAPLFLVVADVARFARQAQIPVSTRGSVANSLVAYCSGITTVDPLAHDLMFERFLNPTRADAPDIDLDFCSRRRDEVLDYVRRTYGDERVALMATVSTLRPRSAARETAKACGLEEGEIKKLTASLPPGWSSARQRQERITLEEMLEGVEDERQRQVMRMAHGIVGQPHHLSVHPGGVVIAPGPLTDVAPLQWAPKGFLITQFGYQDMEALGLPKIDLLGVRALTVLADTAALVRRHYDPAFRLDGIPLPSPHPEHPAVLRTGDLLARAETIGVFQCESVGARRTLRQLQARTVHDLAVANAFFKPGPATGGMAKTFVRRYRGEETVSYLHPALAPILGATQGVLIFQEQILRVAREVAGLSWEQANHLRRGVKFSPEEMAQVREQFLQGCLRLETFTPEQARQLWEQIIAFAGYGLNQGHATAYADVSYRSAHLKAHWPAAFLCARLADRGGFHHPAIYIAEAVRLGIAVRPPHVNYSERKFVLDIGDTCTVSAARCKCWGLGSPELVRGRPQQVEDSKIGKVCGSSLQQGMGNVVLWMGLGQVRDLRRASVRAIVRERRGRPFEGLRDLAGRVALQPKETAHLIQCGALDGLGESRAALLAEAEEIRRAGSAMQMALPFARPAVPPESPAQRLAWEKHLLGQPLSVHPLELVAEHLPAHVPLRRLPEWVGRPVTVAGVRLPGWTGGRGFFLGDEKTFVMVKGSESFPPHWEPLLLRGRWVGDDWGTFWLQVEEIEHVLLERANP
jgi:DNA-directed DNA polymerase III PolC